MKYFLHVFFKMLANKFRPSLGDEAPKIEKAYWLKVNGDQTLRLDYDLVSDSVVFDLGGYKGQWASDIFSRYLCKVHVFEPYVPFCEEIEKRFRLNSNVKCYRFGLGNATFKSTIFFSNDGTSMFKGSEGSEIMIKDFREFIKEQQINEIDLLKINIEGGEYDLLDYLLDTKIVEKIKNIQVQFHDKYVINPEKRMIAIQNQLKQTHELTWQYRFVWENWRRRY